MEKRIQTAPPRDSHSEKGIEAAEADAMVMQGIDLAI